jgi:hypothetical protein
LEAGRRPDLIVHVEPPVTIDVSITDVLLTGDDALDKRAKEKHAHYDGFAARVGVDFVPFVLSTYGAAHPECETFIRKVSRGVPSNLRAALRRKVVVAVQHALLIANAKVARTAAERASNVHTNSRWWSCGR